MLIDQIPAKQEFAAWLRAVAAELEPGRPRFAVLLFDKGEVMGEITVKDSSAPLAATASYLDAKGVSVQPDSTPAWTSSDEAVATVHASEDGLSAVVTIGSPGVTIIEASEAETDEEAGTTANVVAQGTVTVQPGDAVIGSVEFAPPAA